MQPLADMIRPQTLDDVVGQPRITGKNGILRRMLSQGFASNMIFYGPPGTGKTTVANIIAKSTDKELFKLNGTTASISDIREIVDKIDTFLAPGGILLYLDEIQYFNKKQQQSLLEFMENGKLTLIASTTENPYFYVYPAILSRSTVFEFEPVGAKAIIPVIERGFAKMSERMGIDYEIEKGVAQLIAERCGGDVRKALNAVELISVSAVGGKITVADADEVSQRSAVKYDRDGDSYFDVMSALQKSIRGSDPDAAVHYLARLLTADDMLAACRRLLVIASEDIGLAYPQAIAITKACVDSALQLGLPEARIPLAQAAIMLATAPKSNSAICAIDAAMADIRNGVAGDIPRHLRDGHYGGAEKLGNAIGYKYPHAYKNNWVEQQYLPDAIKNKEYYEYGENKTEQAAKRYWEEIKRNDEN